MREYCMRLRALVAKEASDEDIDSEIHSMREQIYRISRICIGTPPKTFTFEYYDKNKAYCKVGPISPYDYYHKHVKPLYDMEQKVVLVNDPRAQNPYNNLYTVDYLGNMVPEGRLVLYINQPVDLLKKVASASIEDNEAVWFGCDVGQHCNWKKLGIEDRDMYDYELVLGTSVKEMNKAERLLFRDSLMTHAMVLTGLSKEGENEYSRWRIENSWGDDGGAKGYLTMTDDWFNEYVYEVVVDKKYVPEEVLRVLELSPTVLPAWDPMGALASFSISAAKL